MLLSMLLKFAAVAVIVPVGSVAARPSSVPTTPPNATTTDMTPPDPDLGINCRGSLFCGSSGDDAINLAAFMRSIPDDAWYDNGQQIACTTNSICAFLQNTGGTNGQVLKTLAPLIAGHGCPVCGSVPYYYPQGDNNVNDGELTFNYVSQPCDQIGLC